MENLSGLDVVLLLIAAYIAVVALVRLMARRREKLLDQLSQDLKHQKPKPVEEAACGGIVARANSRAANPRPAGRG